MESKLDRLNTWMDSLTRDQIEAALLKTVSHCIDMEVIRFWDDSFLPCWSASGEPIIRG